MTRVATVTYPARCSEMIRKLAGEKQNKNIFLKKNSDRNELKYSCASDQMNNMFL